LSLLIGCFRFHIAFHCSSCAPLAFARNFLLSIFDQRTLTPTPPPRKPPLPLLDFSSAPAFSTDRLASSFVRVTFSSVHQTSPLSIWNIGFSFGDLVSFWGGPISPFLFAQHSHPASLSQMFLLGLPFGFWGVCRLISRRRVRPSSAYSCPLYFVLRALLHVRSSHISPFPSSTGVQQHFCVRRQSLFLVCVPFFLPVFPVPSLFPPSSVMWTADIDH